MAVIRSRVSIALVASVLSVVPTVSSAANAWYRGEVARVALNGSDGSFIITMKSGALDDCMHKYAYFKVSVLGAERVSKAYTIALMSLSTGMEMGVVIDKAVNGPGGYCDAVGMTADLRS